MMNPHLLDIGILAFVTISALFALKRGLLGEILTLGAWIGAAGTTLYGLPTLRPLVEESLGGGFWLDLGSGAFLFLLALILYRLIGIVIERLLKPEDGWSLFNHLFGFLFGIGRGVFLVCLGYFLLTQYIPIPQQADYITQSRAFAVIAPVTRKIAALTPDRFQEAFQESPLPEYSAPDEPPVIEEP